MSKLSLYYNVFKCTSDHPQPPEMILVHGWGLHGGVWDDIMPELLKHFQVTLVDLPGLGRSPMPGGDYDLDYLVDHVLNIAPEKAVWLGWSLGGLLAMKVAAEYPERVRGLITVAASPQFVASDNWPVAMNADILQGFIDIFAEDWEGTLVRFLALQCKGSVTIKQDIRQLKETLYYHGLPAQKALREGLHILKKTSLVQSLPQIKCPTLHVLGAHDHIVPVGISRYYKEAQPDSQVAVLRNVSHVPFISAPDLFIKAVYDFAEEQQLVN